MQPSRAPVTLSGQCASWIQNTVTFFAPGEPVPVRPPVSKCSSDPIITAMFPNRSCPTEMR